MTKPPIGPNDSTPATGRPARSAVRRIGHRGAGDHAPHNTLLALQTAADLGADTVELDVRLTRDGVPVLSHDADVRLADGSTTVIRTLHAAELAALGPTSTTGVPTLAAALDLCTTLGLRPYLEIKEPAAVEPLLAELVPREIAQQSVLGSFDLATVAHATASAPQIPTSVLFSDFAADPVALAQRCGASLVHPCWERHPAPHLLLTPDWIAHVRRHALEIVCWHEERVAVLVALLQLEVWGICTNRLDLLRDAALTLPD